MKPSEISERLSLHLLFQKNQYLKTKYSILYKEILSLIGQEKDASMQGDSFARLTKNLEVYKYVNEDTFLNAIISFLLKPQYKTPLNIDKPPVYQLKKWVDDGVIIGVNMQFLNGHLPSQLEYDLVKSMRKCDGMTNAKPDRILGLTRNRFGMSEHLYLWPEIRDLLHIVDDNIWHPFFFIEGKGNQGLVFEAENQARRAGASLVSSLRMFLTKIGIDDVASPGPDNRTFVFSATLSSNALKFWVHWAELQEDRSVHYQMDYVDGCLWQQTERLADMRRVMANIQDWGCGKRRVQLLKYHEKLHTLLQQKMDEGANRRGSGHHSFSATTFAPTSHIV